MKRAQISIFIILGVFLLLTVSIFFIIQSVSVQNVTSQTAIFSGSQFTLYPADQYIELCVENEIHQILLQIASQGGIYNRSTINDLQEDMPLFFEYYDFSNQSFLFHNLRAYNQLPITRSFVSSQIDSVLAQKIDDCFNPQLYIEQGYDISVGDFITTTTIQRDELIIEVENPITVTRGEQEFSQNTFIVSIRYPLGFALDTIRTIVNSEIEDGYFDQQLFMHSYDNVVDKKVVLLIEKYRPYPHVLYKVNIVDERATISFYFGVEGEDIMHEGSIELERLLTRSQDDSCCFIDNACFSQISVSDCQLLQGRSQSSCSCAEERIEEVQSQELKSCGLVESGNSFCTFNTGVGGIFQRELCVDGQWLREDCRDFRQEVCAEDEINGITYSQCRVNTASVCSQCTTLDCCESMDCQFENGICLPKVSSGFSFWDTANSNTFCQDQFSFLGQRVEDSLQADVFCAQLGDCGIQPNFIGEQSVEMDFLQLERLQSLQNAYSSLEYKPSYTLLSELESVPLREFELVSTRSFSEMFAQALQQLDELTSQPIDVFLDPQEPSIISQQYACFSYNAPAQQRCDMCGELSTCTQYACNSLGSSCQYQVIDGEGVCQSSTLQTNQNQISSLRVNNEQARSTFLLQRDGFEAVTNITSNSLIEISFQTTQPSLCKPSYLPDRTFSSIRSLDLSFNQYTFNHTLRIRFVNDLPIFEKLKDRFNVPDFDALVSSIITFKYQIDQLRNRYPFIAKFNPPFFSHITDFVNAYLDESTRPVITELLSLLEDKTFSIFFTCKTQDGYEFSQTPYVLFSVENHCVETPPVIQQVRGDRNEFVEEEFFVFTYQLSTCRVDVEQVSFEEMSHTMSCASSIYDLSSQIEGMYECSANRQTLNISEDTNLYILCKQSQNLFESPFSQDILFRQNDSALLQDSFSIEDIPSTISLRNDSLVELTFQTPHVCRLGLEELPCSLSSCIIEGQLIFTNETLVTQQEKTLSCTQRDSQSFCSGFDPYIQEEHTEFFLQSQPQFSIQTMFNQSQLQVFSLDNRDMSCQFVQLAQTIPLQDENGMLTLTVTSQLENQSGIIRCTDSFSQVIEQRVTLESRQ